jgi:phospholipid/cholesterol/gamma-HCH transport system substrate-binding protein
MTRATRSIALIRNAALAGVLALLVSACSVFGGSEQITLTATFDDTLDLVKQAHVRAGDVPIGVVTDISLSDDMRAKVTMTIDNSVELPRETEAALAKTSMLGERYIDLRPIGEGGSLEDGMELTQTRIIQDFEDLVREGNDTLAYLSAQNLAAAVETGAVAFGGRGSLLGQFITDIETFIGNYDAGRDDLLRLIDHADALTAELVKNADTNAEGFAVLERASQALQDEDERLLDALDDLTALADTGDRIMREHRQEIDNSVRRLRIVLNQVNRIDGSLQNLLTWLPRHNIHVPNGVTDDMAQVWLDFVICGVNDTEGDPSRACEPPNPGEPGSTDKHPTSEECWESHANCEGTQRDER